MDRVLPDTYWVVPGLLLAGRYAGAVGDRAARTRIGRLLDAGIRVFLDLTEEGELPSYYEFLRDRAITGRFDVRYVRRPIADRTVPADDELRQMLEIIEQCVASGEPVFVHCWGGIGRTGTVIGCWLAQNGYAGDAALQRLKELRDGCADSFWDSPEDEGQREFVRAWTRRSAAPDVTPSE